jgi:hypothetical protein
VAFSKKSRLPVFKIYFGNKIQQENSRISNSRTAEV